MSDEDKDNDVLKKLREVRRKLQESLSDDSAGTPKEDLNKKILEEEPSDVGTKDSAEAIGGISGASDGKAPKKPKLYKAGKSPQSVAPKKLKGKAPTKVGLSSKKMAGIQRRIRQKVASRKSMSKKRRAAYIIALFLFSLPLFTLSSLAFATCEFDMSNIGVSYTDTGVSSSVSRVNLYLPVYNPSILPAYIGNVQLQLWDTAGHEIGVVHTNVQKTIAPRQSTKVALELDLNKVTSGKWIADLFNTFMLNLSIENFAYNGVSIPGSFNIPPIDMFGMVKSLLGGFSVNNMLTSLISPTSQSGIYSQIFNEYGINPENNATDIWTQAMQENGIQGPWDPQAAQSTSMSNTYLDISETNKTFSVATSMGFSISPLPNYDLGTIKIFNLTAGLYVDTSKNYDNTTVSNYNYPLITLDSFPSNHSTLQQRDGDVNVVFGGDSEVNLNVSIHKDDIGTLSEHPSANVNWSNPTQVNSFITQARMNDPLYYFLYQLLKEGSMNCALAVTHMDIQIFGIMVPNISIPSSLLGIINVQHLLNIQSLINSTMGGGIFSGIGTMLDVITTGGLGLQNLAEEGVHIESPMSSEPVNMSDMSNIINTDALSNFNMSSISESWGSDANLSLSLPLGLQNFPIDIHVGLTGAQIGLATTINGIEKNFAVATIRGNKSKTVYIGGLGSNTSLVIGLVLYKNSTMAPYVAKFLRGLLEDFDLNATVNLNLQQMILFKENYTIPDIQLSVPLNLSLGSSVSSMISGMFTGMLSPDKLFGSNSSTSSMALDGTSSKFFTLSGDPLTAPYEIPMNLLLKNPVTSFLLSSSGEKWVESGCKDLQSSQIPSASQQFSINVQRYSDRTSLNLVIENLSVGNILPITLGVGPANLVFYAYNQYGEWEKIIGITINNYFEIKPNGDPIDLSMSLQIYDSDALCPFIHQFLDDGIMSIKLDGYMSLNVSGVALPNLHLVLPMDNINTGFSLSSAITDAIHSLASAQIVQPPQSAAKAQWWNGDTSKVPFVSQSLNLNSVFQMGSFQIYSIKENDWPNPNKGNVTIQIGVDLTNNLMDLSITQLEADISYYKNDPNSTMIRISSPGVTLNTGIQSTLKLDITIFKSNYTQDWINNIITSLGLSGFLSANISLNVFNCNIGPISLSGNNSLDLYSIMPNMTSLLDAVVPFEQSQMTNGPDPSQSTMATLGQFALLYVAMPPNSYSLDCGPQNWNEPMMDIRVGLGFEPNFNMSILGGSIQICDANIYNAIYDPTENNVQEASHYSLMANASFIPQDIYFNNTYSCPSDPTNYNIDPNKPYYDNNTDKLSYQAVPSDPNMLPYHLGTYGQFELSLQVFNISYGSFQTAYPKDLWKKMGGPYFPVQVFGKAYGGYPEYRKEYSPYFSPAYNILSSAVNGFNESNIDLTNLLSTLKLNGSITVNIFSMNITLNVGTPAVTNLVGSVMSGFKLGLKQYLKTSTTPFGGYQQPISAFVNQNTGAVNKMTHKPGFPDAASGMALDMTDFLISYPYIGVWERNNHLYDPQNGWGGTNVDPSTPGYVAGVYNAKTNPDASNKETFVKDVGYNDFKITTENYANSMGIPNPYFETYDQNGNYIQNPENWALKWNGPSGREDTNVLCYAQALGPRIPLGLLSGNFVLWIESPSNPCTLTPFGYAWVNESVFVPAVPLSAQSGSWNTYKTPATWNTTTGTWNNNGYWVNSNGKPNPDWYWIMFNIRGFEGPAYYEFIQQICDGFNIRFIASGDVNVSVFGYDLYGASFGGIGMGTNAEMAQKCNDYQTDMGGGGEVWGSPQINGTLTQTNTTTAVNSTFPPTDFYPQYASINQSFFDLSSLTSGLKSVLINALKHANWEEISMTGVQLVTPTISIPQIFPLPAWLININLGLQKSLDTDNPQNASDVTAWENVGYVSSNQMIELETYPGSGVNPLNFNVNNLAHVSLSDQWTFKPITIYLKWSQFNINFVILAQKLLHSWKPWLAPATSASIFGTNNQFLKIDPLTVYVGFPYEFNYVYPLVIPTSEVTFLLNSMY